MTDTIDSLAASFQPWAWDVIVATVAAILGVALALFVHRLLFNLLRRLASHNTTETDDVIVDAMERPTRWSMAVLGLVLAARETPALDLVWVKFAGLVMPLLLGWIAYSLVKGFAQAMTIHALSSDDIAAARSRQTRIAILSRTALLVIVVVTVGLVLLDIPGVKDVGTTLLASAGLAALAVGAAAQPALKSLIAGLQMAITEPVRIGDLVVIDGHTGRIEEIRMSFAIIRTWDERAVLVPTSRFLDSSFENWSRRSEKLTGPVFLHLDPSTEIEPIRTEFLSFLETQPEWDHRTGALLMTEAHPESIELRLGMSAATISDLWVLRCAVREHMIDWLRREMPGALIRRRLEVEQANAKVAKRK
ncbi:mechanosensitive ion channel [Altererythrobacter salegens]|uniref:Mechanosensitive ion channel n=1 Tax=Croceibacterium salegens TaxID=1737568 RepID=A0A6I4SYF8_9SPHN|nr:mechanosensitive ion channel domain-containing protein [Croceibacterium salegens]MXO61144.1 mechanosensitive ion channel [Croceibacterium salegens]